MPPSRTPDLEPIADGAARHGDLVTGVGVLNGVLDERVEGEHELVGIGGDVAACERPQSPVAVGGALPALVELGEHCVYIDRRPVVRADRRGPLDHEQAVDEARHPVELTGHDLVRLGNVDRLGAAGAAQQIHVPTRDRDRRQELVRGVRDEHALAVEIGRPRGGERLRDAVAC